MGPPSASRLHRLVPADAVDVAAFGGIGLGLVLTVVALFTDGGAGLNVGNGLLTFVLGALVVLHASSPVFSILSLAGYLLRQGRVLGAHRQWVLWGVLVVTPLWFLGGLDLTVRFIGSADRLLVPWNLLAVALMAFGVRRTLVPSERGASAEKATR